MPSNLIEAADANDLVDLYALPLYRFHLSLRGERPTALALTIATLRSALTWRDHHSQRAWIFSIARYKQTFALRKFASKPSLPATDRPSGGMLSSAPEAEPVWHAQIAWFAEGLRQLPPDQAESLALVYFAGLDPPEAAAVLRKSHRQVEQHLQNRLAGAQQLLDLANDITLAESELESIRSGLAAAPASHPAWPRYNFWPHAYRLRSSLSRVVPAAALAVLLLAAFVYFSVPNPVKSAALQANGQTPSITAAAVDTTFAGSLQGYLVPPSPNECSFWQNYLNSVFEKKPDLIRVAPFQNPLANGPNESGTACELDLTSLGPGQRILSSLGSEFQTIQPIFAKENYKAFSLPSCGDAKPDGAIYCRSTVFTRSQSRRALLVISGHPLPPGAAPCPTPPPHFSTPLPFCRYSNAIISFTIRLQLADSPVQPVVQDFLSKWTAGSSQVVNHLSGQLRTSLPDLSSLDKLAFIDRSPAGSPSFSARVIDNSGDAVVVELQVDEIRRLPLPSRLVSTVQLQLARSNNNWLIQAIKANPLIDSPGG